jgi:ParB-like chromosome segregation protein Spo0J
MMDNGKPLTFKALKAAGKIKVTDLFKAKLEDIHEEPGFNLRDEGPDLDAHIQNIKNAILTGEDIEPLRLRIGEDGKLYVVDGHCRRRGYILAKQEGAPIDDIPFLPFRGNNVDRVVKILTSQEGKKLSVLEVAIGYKRLFAMHMSEIEIAKRAGKTETHVRQMLALANANSDVHKLVKEGRVSATLAIETVLKRGEQAGPYLQQLVDATGKERITKKVAAGKAPPRKLVNQVFSSVASFAKTIDDDLASKIYEQRGKPEGEREKVTVDPAFLADLLDAVKTLESAQKSDKAE